MNKFFAKNYFAVSAVLGVAAIGGIYWYVHTNTAPSFGTVVAARGNVVASVDQSGNILAENNIALSFQEPGQIAFVNVREGQVVAAGTTLAALDQSSLKAALAQANAAVAAAQAKLDGLTSGTRPEQLAIDKSAVVNAEASLAAALASAYTSADDAVRNQVDNLFANPGGANPIFLLTGGDSQTVTNIQGERQRVGMALTTWYAAMNANSDQASLTGTANQVLTEVSAYLNMVALAVNGALPSSAVPAAAISGYKVNVATARAEVAGAMSAVAAAESALTTAQSKLALDVAGTTPQDLEAQKAAVVQAQAAAMNAQVALDHAALVAPFGGTVENLTAKVGQVVSPGVPVLALVNNGGLKIEVYVSQTDVAKIKEGEQATVTVDAYGAGVSLPAVVTAVGATETTTNGISAYKVTLHLTNSDPRLKDGMTANAHIIVAERDNVIVVPSRLIVNDGDTSVILVKHGGNIEKRKVTVGLSGSGMTEVVSGLSEGELVVNF